MAVKTNDFSPPTYLRSPHLQTILGHYWPSGDDLTPDAEHHIPLEDGDQILLMENLPQTLNNRVSNSATRNLTNIKEKHIILLIHGLSGCYLSNYLVRLNRSFVEQGFHSFRMNLRGAGPSWRLSRKSTHAGRSEDLRTVLKWLNQQHSSTPISIVGFSLGGNILIKTLGETHTEGAKEALKNVIHFVAVSPPLDLQRAVSFIEKPENRMYSYFFAKNLKREIKKLQRHFSELQEFDVTRANGIRSLDESFTAPLGGFTSVDDYYSQSSCLQFLENVRTKGLILGAYDDPIINGSIYKELKPHSYVNYSLQQHGGHVGFLEKPFSSSRADFRWMDRAIIQEILKSPL